MFRGRKSFQFAVFGFQCGEAGSGDVPDAARDGGAPKKRPRVTSRLLDFSTLNL